MAYEVVARRWRPLTFASVVGQKHVTETLARALEQDRVAHAFLFTGIRGVGKTTIARLLARALNCTERKGAEPCNACSSCTQILSGSSVDVLEIDGASNRGIDEVRALIDAAAYRPAGGRYRVYIIDEVHQLTREAFNALLKILEEPPDHVKFVLATTEPHKLPQTVLSRCQRYDFRRLTAEEIQKQLARIVEADKLEVADDALALIAREADGSMRDAQSMLEQVVAATGGKADAAAVSDLLGIARTELILGCVEAMLETKPERIVEAMRELRRGGFDAERFLAEVTEALRHVAVAQVAGADALGPAVPEAVRTAAARLKDVRHPLDVQRIFGVLLQTADDLRRGSMPELVLEMGLLKAAMLESVTSAADVLERLEQLAGGGFDGGGPSGGGAGRGRQGAAASAPSRARASAQALSDPSRARASGPNANGPSHARASAREASTPSSEQASMPAARASSHATANGSAPFAPPPDDDDTPIDATPAQVRGAVASPSDETAAGGEEASEESIRWEGFLQFVRERAGFDLYVTLSNCEVVRLEASKLELRAVLDGFRRRLEAHTTLEQIRALASEHFADGIVVELVSQAGERERPGLSAHAIEAKRASELEERALADPLVQTALSVLGGKVGKISRLDDE